MSLPCHLRCDLSINVCVGVVLIAAHPFAPHRCLLFTPIYSRKISSCHLEQTAKVTTTTLLEAATPAVEVAIITRTVMGLITIPTTTEARTTTMAVVVPPTLRPVGTLLPLLKANKERALNYPRRFSVVLMVAPLNGCYSVFVRCYKITSG